MPVTFSVIQTGRNPRAAFNAARDHALYMWGHAGGSGSIAEKSDYRLIGQLGSRYLDNLDLHLNRTIAWHNNTYKNRARLPTGVPSGVVDLLLASVEMYLDPNAPAVCFQITGRKAVQIKKAMGRARTRDKVYWFGGMSPYERDRRKIGDPG